MQIPAGLKQVELELPKAKRVRLTNLDKLFWPERKITKRDLLNYYAAVSPVLVPNLVNRAMVMRRYPNGATGEAFFMKRTPPYRPDWLRTCSIKHSSGNVIDFPVVDDLASLLWVVNLGCIDLNQWYATCDDVDRPDYVHFDLDPTPGATFQQVCQAALQVHQALDALKMPNYAKTTGSRGIHVYVPIVRSPVQKQVWAFAKQLALAIAAQYPETLTAIYKVADRPDKHVLVDYNQNAWGRTLASVYSVRPKPCATVSAPVTWEEIQNGIRIEDFRIDNMPDRIRTTGDLWKPMLSKARLFRLEKYL